MQLNEQLVLWNHASLKIADIRHDIMPQSQVLRSYRLPTSVFLYAVRGKANLQLDGERYHANRFLILHGGKGSVLEIAPIEEVFEYYMIYYKATISLPARQEIVSMLERANPFHLQYGFIPENPVDLLQKVDLMQREWEAKGGLERFHVKSIFYQFVYELLWQLHNHKIPYQHKNLVEQALDYIQKNYYESISVELLADILACSSRHLSRLFKRQTGSTPIDYMIKLRMEKAKELLLTTEASLQEIAEGIGYADKYYFAKMFKRYTGIPPIRYRTEHMQWDHRPKSTSVESLSAIVPRKARTYIDNDCENHCQYREEGNMPMFTGNKAPWALILLLCLALQLSACSAGTAGNSANNGGQASTAPAQTAVTVNQTEASPKTKMVTTVKGEVEVPVNPQRVVVLYLLGDVLALNVKPVGVSDVEKGAVFENQLDGVASLGNWFEPNPEAILALNPDLIIVPSEETYQSLHNVAPTVYVPYESMSVEERLKKIGEVLGKEGESQALLENFYAKVEESKKKLKEAGIMDKTVSIMEGGKGSMGVVNSKQYGRGSQVIYEYLGMRAPAIIQEEVATFSTNTAMHNVSFEVLPVYAGDYVFRSSYEGMVDLSQNSVWNSIPAVKEGRLIEISFGLSYYNDIYSLDKQLDFIVESLLAAKKK
ncbi:helix-turn-helix domain-containing protein [Brevibacillus sp. SIMBA_040]|uniref:helix-turn-helix domain-containing protein n=2 Tax=Bacteria TaxID=2 RepID=UPI00397A7C0B